VELRARITRLRNLQSVNSLAFPLVSHWVFFPFGFPTGAAVLGMSRAVNFYSRDAAYATLQGDHLLTAST
jgi:hypothetical protein